MTTLIIVRHAETEANVQQVWQGTLDAPLTRRGQKQVMATAQHMAHLVQESPVDRFYVSPLPRAQRTAAGIATAIGMTPLIEAGLREFDLGDWEGRT
ncbi:MAG: histidine phosphatase family protein, partial [Caldilineaceae bacterium]|nr:histidine phosphatase family protein [Caldilineaceae bacterium]